MNNITYNPKVFARKEEILRNITSEFYKQIATEFDSTRQQNWEGWEKLLEYINNNNLKPISTLDIACGNGRFLNIINKIPSITSYLGFDNNETLLEFARNKFGQIADNSLKVHFDKVDLYDDWRLTQEFDLVVAFGIAHHLISFEKRLDFFKKIHNALSKDGFAVVTFWDFLSDPKLNKKIVDVRKIEAQKDQIKSQISLHKDIIKILGDNDYILDWKAGKVAYRFAHNYHLEEITSILNNSGLQIVSFYKADGATHQANQYYILKKLT